MPMVGLGTVVRYKGAKSRPQNGRYAALATALQAHLRGGGRTIDTAPTYGHGASHAEVAAALRSRWAPARAELFAISKIPPEDMGYRKALLRINRTLEELATPYVDLMLIHRPHGAPNKAGARVPHVSRGMRISTWKALLHAQAMGLVRHVGVANYGIVYLRELEEAGLPPPAAQQLEFHPWIDERQWELVRFCQARGMRIIGYNSLGGLGASRSVKSVSALSAELGRTEAQVRAAARSAELHT